MAPKLLSITRAFEWLAKTFVANRDAIPLPRGFWNTISPTVDVFGTERMGNFGTDPSLGFAEVQGALGGLEVSHSLVALTGRNAPRVRLYLSMEYWHDDPVPRVIRPGRIVPTGTGFPFVAHRDGATTAGDVLATGIGRLAVRNFTVGPNMAAAARANAMGVGARLTIRVMWIEMNLGEYARSVS